MFSIGQHLSEQRRRRRLRLEECEAATHIRGRYLVALEEDRPEDIPDPAYARLFLRGYATFLELDVDALLAEYDEQRGSQPPLDEHRMVPIEPEGHGGRLDEVRTWLVRPRRRSRRREATWIGAGLLGLLAVVVWMGARSDSGGPPPAPPAEAAAATRPRAPVEPVAAPSAPRPVRLVLTGAGTAGSWVKVQRGGPSGPVAWEGTVAPAQVVRLPVRGGLWMRIGWAPSVRVTLGGRAVPLAADTGDWTVTRAGVVPAA